MPDHVPIIYHLLIVAGLILALYPVIFRKKQATTVTPADDFFILEQKHFLRLVSLVLILAWVIYQRSGRYFYSQSLSDIHVGLTLALVVVLTAVIRRAGRHGVMTGQSGLKTVAYLRSLNRSAFFLFLGFAIAQFLLLANLALGFYYR